MIYYLLIFAITSILAFQHIGKKRVSFSAFMTYIMLIGIFVGISDMLGGYDRYIYADAYEALAWEVRHEGWFKERYYLYFSHEPVFGILLSALGAITSNRYIFILVITLIFFALFGVSIYRNMKNPFWGALIFLGLLFFFTFAYMRQILAVSVAWMSLPYLIRRNPKKFFTIVIVAALIHNSAVYFALLYFMPLKKYHPDKILQVMFLLLILGFTNITSVLFLFYGESVESASGKAQMYATAAQHGFRIEYVIESLLFLYILLQNYKYIGEDRRSLVLLNTYLFFCGILLMFCRSTDGGRISWYSMIGLFALLSKLSLKVADVRNWSFGICLALYLRILIVWGIQLTPYKTFFTNGHRQGDIIYELYEYNDNYDKNKFYNLWNND